MNDSQYEYWTVKDHEVLSFTPTTNYLAVFAEDNEDGSCSLISVPIDGISAARVVEQILRRPKGRERPLEIVETITYHELVGVILISDGSFDVVNDDSDYGGLCRVGDDINTATGHLHTKYLQRLKTKST